MARPQDAYGRRAKRAGYPARSVYKLQEIDRRVRILKPGQRVLDLGAAPGSWTLYVAEQVGPLGSVVGIDIQPCQIELPPNASIRQGDVFTSILAAPEKDRTFDVVLSDLAPSTSGNRARDQYLSYELFVRALAIAREVLKPNGSFLGKIFQGPEFQDARKALEASFTQVRIFKPQASRRESYELFLLGLKKKRS